LASKPPLSFSSALVLLAADTFLNAPDLQSCVTYPSQQLSSGADLISALLPSPSLGRKVLFSTGLGVLTQLSEV